MSRGDDGIDEARAHRATPLARLVPRGSRLTRLVHAALAASLTACGSDDTTAGAANPENGNGCTRAALEAAIDAYFDATASHDPSALAVSPSVRFTENAVELELGDGLWKTAGAVQFHRDALDTERCATVTKAVIENDGTPTIVGLRLKLEDGALAEVESYVVDPATGFVPTPQGLIDSAGDDWESLLDPADRSTREELDAAADAYFDLFSNPAAPVPFGVPCDRLENGFKTTNGRCSDGVPPSSLQMTHRRFPVADLESGIAVGFTLFGGSLLDFHMFKLTSGEIRFINAVVGPSAPSPNWPIE